MFIERTSVGLDVHARSIVAAAVDGVTGELHRARLTPSYEHVRSWLADPPVPVAVVYEAGPTGFGLYRALTGAGFRCVVAAPSKLQRPSGYPVKTDARDAVHLARPLRLDELTPVAVPSVEQEAARDLVRAREDARADLMRARHRLSKVTAPARDRLLRWCRVDRPARCVAAQPHIAAGWPRRRLRRRSTRTTTRS